MESREIGETASRPPAADPRGAARVATGYAEVEEPASRPPAADPRGAARVATDGEPLLLHIRHAEDWLRRARAEWRRGNAPGAVLRLMLAEAEIRHARERGATAAAARADCRRTSRAAAAAAAIAAAAVLAGGIGYTSLQVAAPRHTAALADGAPAAQRHGGFGGTIVQLDSGQFLMPDRGPSAAGGSLQLAAPVDLRTPSPTF